MRTIVLFGVGILGYSLSAIAQQPVKPQANANPEIAGKSLDQWIKEIEDRDPSVREHAIKMVALLGPQARRAIPALIRQAQIDQNDLSPRTNAVIAIGLIVPDDPKHVKDAVAALMPLLSSPQGIIRLQAATTMGNLGTGARTATSRLTHLIKDPASWEIRKAAAYALGRTAYDDHNMPDMRALAGLADAVDDVSKEVRVEALQGLINLGPPPSAPEQQQLKALLEKRIKVDKDKYVGIWVRVALMRMDAASVTDTNISYIAKQLKATDPPGIAADAARALGAMGPVSGKKVGDLMEALKSSDASLVAWSAWALGRIGSDAKAALPALMALKESAEPSVKNAAAEAIKDINNPPKRAG